MRIVCSCGSTQVETVGRAVGQYAIRYAGCFACNRGFIYEWTGLGSTAVVTELESPYAARTEYATRLRAARAERPRKAVA